jgi:hypothetical protein
MPPQRLQDALSGLQQGLQTASRLAESPGQAATRVAQEDKALALQRQREQDTRSAQQQQFEQGQSLKTSQLAQATETERGRHNLAAEKQSADKIESQLRAKGFRTNASTGDIENVPYNELSAEEQAKVGTMNALTGLRDAQANKAAASKNLDFEKYQLAERNTRVAEQSLGLRQQGELRRGKMFDLSSGKEAVKIYDPALDADKRLKVMMENAKDPSGQGDISLLFNHIGMTLSAQKGARVTEAEINNAIKARSVPQDLLAAYTRAQNGQFLTPDQRGKMVDLAVSMREEMWDKSERQAGQFGDTGLSMPAEHPTLPARKNAASAAAQSGASQTKNDPLGIR